MLAIVSAYDLKYIELEDAIERISKTLETIQKLQKWNGATKLSKFLFIFVP